MEFQKNKPLLAVIALLLVFLAAAIFFYNRTLNDLATGSCTDTSIECPHEKVLETQNLVIAMLIGVIALVAGWLAYHGYWKKESGLADEESLTPVAAPHAHLHTPTRKVDLSSLDSDEKKVIAIVQEQGGSTFQSELIKQTNYSKVKISRVLDKLEQKGMIERKRRGMTNLVVIK